MIRAEVYGFLELSETEPKNSKMKALPFSPSERTVVPIVKALETQTIIPMDKTMPGWLKGKPPEGVDNLRELVAVKNGLLYLPSRKLWELTPRFWSPNVLEFEYQPEAECRRFKQFLEELWPGDEGAQRNLLRVIGLCLTDETRHHKAFVFTGPKRSGKGTIGRLIQGLLGKDNYVSTSLREISERFGMWPLIGKKVAVFSDETLAGLSRDKLANVVTKLKKTTGEDDQTIDRKNIGIWEGKLTARVIIFTNKPLQFADNALNGRLIHFPMERSWSGNEQLDLTEELLSERPGILNMVLGALDEIRAPEFKFKQHGSGQRLADETNEEADLQSFIDDRCYQAFDAQVLVSVCHQAFREYCKAMAIAPYGWEDEQFSKKIRELLDKSKSPLRSSRPRKDNPGRRTMLHGIGLRGVEAEPEPRRRCKARIEKS
jgi:P4 family phage/plasmid primase-like protien